MGGEPKLLNCEKRSGQLICTFRSNNIPITIYGGVTDKGEVTIIKTIVANKDGVDMDTVRKAEKFTLDQIKMKRLSEGEF